MAGKSQPRWVDGRFFETMNGARQAIGGFSADRAGATEILKSGGVFHGHLVTLEAPEEPRPVKTYRPKPIEDPIPRWLGRLLSYPCTHGLGAMVREAFPTR
jgi:hypothetical protein